MTNRKLAYIVKDQKPLMLATHDTVQHACRCMRERRAGSVLVIDDQQRLRGIFTGRDAVPLAEGKHAAVTTGDDAESRHDHAGKPRHRRAAGDERWRLPSSSGRRE